MEHSKSGDALFDADEFESESGQPPTVKLLEEIGAAFNRHDVEGILSFFAEEGEFVKPAGPDYFGERFVGKQVVGAEFATLFAAVPDLHWEPIANWVSGDKGCSEWRRTGTTTGGERQDWLGCDLFTFRNGKVIKKDSYFKIVR